MTKTLDQVRQMMWDRGARRLLAKLLSSNDNSKNQIYLGGDFGVMNLIPAKDPVAATSGTHKQPIFKAALDFSWLDEAGQKFAAPKAQLILYPQYPEVRMSGYLSGAKWAPSDLFTVRDAGRVLILGITEAGEVLGYAASADSALAAEVRAQHDLPQLGVLLDLGSADPNGVGDTRPQLLAALCAISEKGWIESWRLGPNGERLPCPGTNCVGVTLESELGITPNGRSEPDYLGWEVKALTVSKLDAPKPATVTLMTPEPTGGEYVSRGVKAFIREYGYPDKRGRENRLNFGGVHRVGIRQPNTNLLLEIEGYDADSDTITRSDGQLRLTTVRGTVAASWDFPSLLKHWNRKHAQAAYVPARSQLDGSRRYRYGPKVLLATGTDFLTLLASVASGEVYYDPGIKLEHVGGRELTKRRSQWRVAGSSLGNLYRSSTWTSTCA